MSNRQSKMAESPMGRRSGRASASKAKETISENIKKAKIEEAENDLGDISYEEDSEEEYQVPKKKKKGFRDDSDEDSDLEGRKSAKKKSRGPMAQYLGLLNEDDKTFKRSRPGPKSKKLAADTVKKEKATLEDDKTEKQPLLYPQEKFDRMFKKWKDPLTYTCEICTNFTTSVVSSLSKHLKDYHKIKLEDYDEIYGVEERDHTCLLCKTKVSQCGEKLEGHFADQHEGRLRQYFEEHILKLLPSTFGDAPTPQFKPADIKSENGASLEVIRSLLEEDDLPSVSEQGGGAVAEASNSEANCQESVISSTGPVIKRDFCRLCGDAVIQEVEAIRNHFEKVHVTEKDRELQRWSQQVTFRPCKICGDSTSRTLGDFKRHVLDKHGYADTNAYVGDHMNFFKEVVYHACLICQSSVLHDHGRLSKHLMDKCKGEGVNLAAYFRDHVVPSGQANPQRLKHAGNNNNKLKNDVSPVDPDVQQKYVKWLYQVEWECSKCQQLFNQYCQLRFHMKSDHQASMPFMKKGMKVHPLAKKAVHHNCKLCDAKILHDNEYLAPHFSKEHDLGGLEYFGKHLIDENGELIP